MAEMAQTAEHVIVVGREADRRCRHRGPSCRRIGIGGRASPEAEQLRQALAGPDVTITAVEPGVLQIRGISTEQVGEAARGHGLAIYELRLEQASLEDVFMTMTSDAVEYHAHICRQPRHDHHRSTMATAEAWAEGPERRVPVPPVNTASVTRSEWIKFRTLRSSWIVIAVTMIAIIGIGMLVSVLHQDPLVIARP